MQLHMRSGSAFDLGVINKTEHMGRRVDYIDHQNAYSLKSFGVLWFWLFKACYSYNTKP